MTNFLNLDSTSADFSVLRMLKFLLASVPIILAQSFLYIDSRTTNTQAMGSSATKDAAVAESDVEVTYAGKVSAWVNKMPSVGRRANCVFVQLEDVTVSSATFITSDGQTIAADVRDDGVIQGGDAVLSNLAASIEESTMSGVDLKVHGTREGKVTTYAVKQPRFDVVC